MSTPTNPICLALDTSSREEALNLAEEVGSEVGMVKVGLQLFCAEGLRLVKELSALDLPVFLDLKFNDIPNTVAGAVRSVMSARPQILNVHALGGITMMKAALCAARESSQSTQVVAVTVLTSLDDAAVETELGIDRSAQAQALHLALMAREAGLDGVVCSPREVGAMRRELGDDFLLISPGIRPQSACPDDQARFSCPKEAIDAGADVLVVGRPISRASDPRAAAKRMWQEVMGRT